MFYFLNFSVYLFYDRNGLFGLRCILLSFLEVLFFLGARISSISARRLYFRFISLVWQAACVDEKLVKIPRDIVKANWRKAEFFSVTEECLRSGPHFLKVYILGSNGVLRDTRTHVRTHAHTHRHSKQTDEDLIKHRFLLLVSGVAVTVHICELYAISKE